MKCAWLILTLCATAYGQTPAPNQAQAPPKGSLSGQVVNAKTGAPLKKANVRLNMIMNSQGRGPVAAPLPAPNAPGQQAAMDAVMAALRSEERRVGKECRSR